MEDKNYWKKCSTCKVEIPFSTAYYICSVSTCQGKRLGLHFCSIICWDAHLGFARHRDAGALDAVAPTREACLQSLEPHPPRTGKAGRFGSNSGERPSSPEPPSLDPNIFAKCEDVTGEESTTRKIIVRPATTPSTTYQVETLVVVSKVKQLIRDQSTMNTSQCAIDALTQKVVEECQKAIEKARSSGRKTVMGRDVE